MKTVLTSVLLCAFLQMVWVSLSTGQTDPALKCSDFNDNSTQCCENASCIFYQCSQPGSDEKCVSSEASPPECQPNGTATATCNSPPSTTANPGDMCNSNTSKAACCGVDQCGFFHCDKQGAENTTVCALNNSTTACKEGTQSNNTCEAEPTTTPPTPHPAADACAKHNNSQTECCAAASTDGCAFYKCKSITVCLKNTTAKKDVCSATGEMPTVINCTETPTTLPTTTPGHTTPQKPTSEGPTTSPTPTKAPSGSGSGGRHFDGASFIGGIVLCAGIFAIGYFGLKFYKSRQERNYHTL